MSVSNIDQRPTKKRRFFAEESPVEEKPVYPNVFTTDQPDASSKPSNTTTETISDTAPPTSSQTNRYTHNGAGDAVQNGTIGFDKDTFESFVGDKVVAATFEKLREVSGDNMERAINIYLDGSWMKAPPATTQLIRPNSSPIRDAFSFKLPDHSLQQPSAEKGKHHDATRGMKTLEKMPEYRYVGAFGVGAWATRSGTGLLKIGETVNIERTKIKPPVKIGRGGKALQPAKLSVARMRVDVIVRFTNTRGEEVGRLPKETADWVSTLMDQNVCRFDGICFLAPERIRVNDTIELQLRCSLLKKAFEASGFRKPSDNNRTTGIFEEKETSEEKDLRLRQVALVKLFNEINLHPCTINDTTAKHKRQGILQAAEIAEQYDKEKENKKPSSAPDGSSTPPDEEAEEGKELEQDQLDSLYKKAQTFDFDTHTREPADTFVMDLRKYQKQALHWMISKEKDERSETKEVSMHPLWEEYSWPTKDMDDQLLPAVARQSSFYVNPYSGELSLEFPAQEQHCLGGILADGMFHQSKCGDGKTNVPRNGSWEDYRDAQSDAYSQIGSVAAGLRT